jgi:phage recombination protein Bet
MGTAVQVYEGSVEAYAPQRFNQSQLELLKTTIAKDTTDDQFSLFIEVAERTGLNPFARQLYAIVRNGKMTIQTGIDGYRLIAQRTGEYTGQRGPQWCGKDGVWREVWLEQEAPAAARVGVMRAGFVEPVWGVATYKSYHQDNSPTWRSMPDVMIAKCAEALALRKAFPQELSGLYADEELGQADSEATSPRLEPFKRPQSRTASPVHQPFDPETGETWNLKDLADALKAAGIKMPDLAKVLDVPAVTKENAVDAVDRYMSEHPGTSLMQLVELAVESQFEPAPDAAIDAEQQPEMVLS